MPCEHVRALLDECRPGVSVRQLERAAGLPRTRIAYYLDPTTPLDRMPPLDLCKDVASAAGCDLVRVVEAFAADIGYPWGQPAEDPEERALLRRFRTMTPDDQRTFVRISQSLTGGMP